MVHNDAMPAPTISVSSHTFHLLIAITAVMVVSNVAAILLGRPSADRTRRALPWLQRSTSLQVALIAWVFWIAAAHGSVFATYSFLVSAGLSVSFVADLIMADILRVPNRVIGGIVVFGVAHVLYITAYLTGGLAAGVLRLRVIVGSEAAWLAVGLLLWNLLVKNPDAPRTLTWGALGYTLLVTTMVATAVALALCDSRFVLLAPAAIVFLISDLILGNQIFRRNDWPYVAEVVWSTYIVGQTGIVWGMIVSCAGG